MIEQVRIFGYRTSVDTWQMIFSEKINTFLAEKNEKGEYKAITRVLQLTAADATFIVITIFYQWVKEMPDMGVYRTLPRTPEIREK